MRRFIVGVIVGLVAGLVLASATMALAGNPIRLVINGQEIRPDVPPQLINGRTMVPLRFVAQAMGADVDWDAKTATVTITSSEAPDQDPTPTPTPGPAPVKPAPSIPSTALGASRTNPVPAQQSFITADGLEVSVLKLTGGDQAWKIIQEANMYNDPPDPGMQYVLVTVKIKNVDSEREPALISRSDFELVGSSNKVFSNFDRSVVLPNAGEYAELWAQLYHGGETTGTLNFYVPQSETNLLLIWNYQLLDQNRRYFKLN